MPKRPTIVWVRDDLRLADNPALTDAIETDAPIVLLYVLDEMSEGIRPLGGASRWWLHHSLRSLSDAIAARGNRLILRRGPAVDVIATIADELRPSAICWNRRYGAAEREIDRQVSAMLKERGIDPRDRKGNLLFEPWEVKTKQGSDYRVFTPFKRALLAKEEPREPLPEPDALAPPPETIASDDLDGWRLLPTAPDWTGGLRETWTSGEAGARDRLESFLDRALAAYRNGRNLPATLGTSMLSPHLRFGEISPCQVWASVKAHRLDESEEGRESFLSEIVWREFSYNLLYHHPELARRNYQEKFDRFAWSETGDPLHAWQRGRTGYPIVDAGMRQLWRIGWMHNRVRMIAASFLVKHLLIDWRLGEAWFWDTLVDADPANNPASWQWIAGSGVDAQPFFRVMNPTAQSRKFDAKGDYIRRWVPELAELPSRHVHEPWTAPDDVLAKAGVTIGETYPSPLIDHASARERALATFRAMRREAEEA